MNLIRRALIGSKGLAIAGLLAAGSAAADHNTEESLHMRLAPVGELNVMTAEEAASVAAAAAPAQVAAAEVSGESVYNTACLACHGAGVAGAPRVGDVAGWQPRIGKGLDILVDNAIKGYQGEAGVMPARGGNASLSDEEVIAAVEFMVDNSQ